MIREVRRTQNSKQDKIQVVKSQPSINSLREGQEVIYIAKSNRLERYRKEKGRLWVSYMDTDNNYTVNKNLNVGGNLNVKGSFLGNSYKIIAHNMTDDIGTDPVYLPWFGISELDSLNGVSSSFLVPYKMTLQKIMFRPTTITNTSHDLRVRLMKMDDGDTAVDTVATANHTDALASGTLFTINRSNFDNAPRFGIGDSCGIEITATGDYGSEIVWKITSVWEVEILN